MRSERVRLATRRGVSTAAALLVMLGVLVVSAPARATVTRQARTSAVTMTVLSVNPPSPAITPTDRPVVITVRLVNDTDQTVSDVSVDVQRGDPITSQSDLDNALTATSPAADQVSITPSVQTSVQLAPHATVTTTFRTSF